MSPELDGALRAPAGARPATPAAEGGDLAALLRGVEEYRGAGRLPDAEALLRHAMQLAGDAPEVLHLAGALALEAGRPGEALELLGRALERHPRLAAAQTCRGDALRALRRPDEAIAAYRAALALDSGSAAAWCHLGHALRDLSRPDEALRAYREAIAREPGLAEAHLSLGLALGQVGEQGAALGAFEAAVRAAPQSAPALDHLGQALRRAGRLAEAAEAARRAVALDPRSALACCHLGQVLLEQEQHSEAAEVLHAALSLDPELPEARHAMGRVLQALGYLDQSLSAFRQALAVRPDYADAHLSLGILLDLLGRPVEALASCQAALTFAPECGPAFRQMARVLRKLDRFTEAVAAYRRAMAHGVVTAEIWAEYGEVLRLAGRFSEAVAAYDEVLARTPDALATRWQRGLAQLALGNYQEGWEGYEARWRVPELGLVERGFDRPRWAGESLEGRTIFVYAEAGIAETLQFVRYLPVLSERGARVILECHPTLRRLLEAMPCVSQAIAAGDPPPLFDCHIALGSLPGVLSRATGPLPESVPYLPTRIWSSRVPLLPAGEGLKIGLALGEGPGSGATGIPPRALAQLLGLPGVTWYRLAPMEPAARLDTLDGPTMHDLVPQMKDWAEAAPLLSQLDLVIATDGAVAHLSGGVGATLWVVTGASPAWMWYGEGDRSAWYPLARVFPQPQGGDWGAVVDGLKRALLAALAA